MSPLSKFVHRNLFIPVSNWLLIFKNCEDPEKSCRRAEKVTERKLAEHVRLDYTCSDFQIASSECSLQQTFSMFSTNALEELNHNNLLDICLVKSLLESTD